MSGYSTSIICQHAWQGIIEQYSALFHGVQLMTGLKLYMCEQHTLLIGGNMGVCLLPQQYICTVLWMRIKLAVRSWLSLLFLEHLTFLLFQELTLTVCWDFEEEQMTSMAIQTCCSQTCQACLLSIYSRLSRLQYSISLLAYVIRESPGSVQIIDLRGNTRNSVHHEHNEQDQQKCQVTQPQLA